MAWLSIDIRKLVIQKLKYDLSQRKIAIQLNISRHTVYRVLLKFKQHKTLKKKKTGNLIGNQPTYFRYTGVPI